MEPTNDTFSPSLEGENEAITAAGPSWTKYALLLIIAVLLVGTLVTAYLLFSPKIASDQAQPLSPQEEDIVRIGLSLDSVKIQRWAEERDFMIQKAESLGATVTVFSAENDDAKQIEQIQNLISQKVDAIIVVAHDAEAVGPVLSEAQDAGIKVINYDRLTKNGKPDLYLSFDSVKVGEYVAQHVIDAIPEGVEKPKIAYVGGSETDNNSFLVRDGVMKVLDPLLAEDKIDLVYNEFTVDWSPSAAYSNFQKFLNDGKSADGVITAYDGLAYGVVQALAEKGLAGKIPVTGQNGEMQAMQRIVQGTQTMTAWKPGKPLAEKAVEAAFAFASGKQPEINGTVDNGIGNIPSYLFDPIAITKENINTVIEAGAFTKEQIFVVN